MGLRGSDWTPVYIYLSALAYCWWIQQRIAGNNADADNFYLVWSRPVYIRGVKVLAEEPLMGWEGFRRKWKEGGKSV